jgi:hypothetical protein
VTSRTLLGLWGILALAAALLVWIVSARRADLPSISQKVPPAVSDVASQRAATAPPPDEEPGRETAQPQASEEAASHLEITGRVLDPAGRPIADAEVLRAASEYRSVDEVVARTDADGGFRYLPPVIEPLTLTFRAAGFLGVRRTDVIAGARLVVVLDAGVAVRGRAVDAVSDEAIAGAHVRVQHGSRYEDEERLLADSEGFFSFAISGRAQEVVVEADGYVPCRFVQVAPPEDGQIFIVRLPRASELPLGYFRVVDDASGDLLERATIRQVAAERVGPGLFRGAYDVSFETRSVVASAEDHVERHVRFRAPLGDSPETPFEVRLARAAVIRGKVVDRDGDPLASARVALDLTRPAPEDISAFPPTDPVLTRTTGEFEISGILPGSTFEVLLEHDRFAPTKISDVTPERPGPMDLGSIVLTHGSSLDGFVLAAEDGSPIAQARILLLAEGAWRYAVSDAAGRFRFDHTPERVTLQVTAEGRVPRQLADLRVPVDLPIEVKLESGLSLSGIVLDSDDRGVAGVPIQVAASHHGQDDEFAQRTLERGVSTMTAEDGRFRVGGLLAGPCRITAGRGLGYGEVEDAAPNGTVEAGRANVVIRWRRPGERPISGVKGRVVDARHGRSLSRFSYLVSPTSIGSAGTHGSSVTNAAGEFFVPLEADTAYEILVWAPGFAREIVRGVRVSAGESRTERFALPQPGIVEGRVQTEHAGLVANAKVQFVPEGIRLAPWLAPSGVTDAAGRFRVSDLAAGPHRVTVVLRDVDPWGGTAEHAADVTPATLELRASEEHQVDLTVHRPAGVSVEGEIAFSDDGDPWRLGLTLSPVAGSGAKRRYDHQGKVRNARFRFPNVEPGTYDVFVVHTVDFGGSQHCGTEPKRLVVPPEGALRVTLRVPALERNE